MFAETKFPTVIETLDRIYDELDGIVGGECLTPEEQISPRTAADLEEAMSLIHKSIDREGRIEALINR